MLIAGEKLFYLIDDNVITANPDNVNAASIDITLGDTILIEDPRGGVVDITDKNDSMKFDTIRATDPEAGDQAWYNVDDFNGYFAEFRLAPGQCILAESLEIFNLPNNISAEYKLKSSMARNFLEHLNAGWCDAGWHGSKLTLELKNMSQYHSLIITPRMKIGQIVFFEHEEVSESQSYASKGQYNGDKGVQTSKGVK